MAQTGIAGATPPWLFQGMRIGEPLSHAHAAKRLKRLGISETSASKFYRLAGGEWNRYAAGSVSW